MSLEYMSQINTFSYIFLLSEVCQNVSNSQNKQTGCCCGLMFKSRGLTDIASCMQSDKSRCSCLRNQQTCTRPCRCINCNNQRLQEKGAVSKRKAYTCRSLNKVKARQVSCKDHVERKSRCLCLHVGVKCNSISSCTNCANGKDFPNKRCSNTTNPQTCKP